LSSPSSKSSSVSVDTKLCPSNSLDIGGICVSYQTLAIVIGVVLLLIGIYMSMNMSSSYDE
jgi:hypothetical protein